MAWDVAIVGGGVMGCAIAHRLARRGVRRVVVLERSIPGAEASSAAGGILGAQAESAGGGPFLDLCLRSRAAWGALAAELREASGVDVGYWTCGLVKAALSAEDEARLCEVEKWQRAAGLAVERLDATQLRALEPELSERARMGLYFCDDAQVDPRALMRSLQLSAAAAGVAFRSGYVRRVVTDSGVARGVELHSEVVEAGSVVLAAGSWSSLVDGTALPPRAVRPVRGQMVELETRPPMVRHVLFSGHGYVVPRRDGRLVVGSTMEQVGFQKEVTAGGLRSILSVALELVPRLHDAPVIGHWSNFRPFIEDGLPALGPTPIQGLYVATGHYRNGILLTPASADAIAACIVDGKPPFDLAPFAPGRLGTPDAASVRHDSRQRP